MNFIIDSKTLRTALETANKAVKQKSTIPALDNFLIEGDGQTLTITGSDAENTVRVQVPCQAEGSLLFTPSLLELARTLPVGDVSIETDDTTATIKWKKGQSTLPVLPSEDYPEIATLPDDDYLTLDGTRLSEALVHIIPHTANDDLRPIMCGALFNGKEDGTLDIVASDAHTLGLFTIGSQHKEPFNVVIPANALKFVVGAAKDGDVAIACDETNIFFKAGDITVITRQIEGKFPAYNSVIPKNFVSEFVADKAELLSTIKRVLVCASKASGHIKFTLGALGSEIEAQDLTLQTSAREYLDGEFNGDDITIGFKGEYLIKCINAIESDTIKIKFNGANKAAVVTSEDDPSTALCMPVQIQ